MAEVTLVPGPPRLAAAQPCLCLLSVRAEPWSRRWGWHRAAPELPIGKAGRKEGNRDQTASTETTRKMGLKSAEKQQHRHNPSPQALGEARCCNELGMWDTAACPQHGHVTCERNTLISLLTPTSPCSAQRGRGLHGGTGWRCSGASVAGASPPALNSLGTSLCLCTALAHLQPRRDLSLHVLLIAYNSTREKTRPRAALPAPPALAAPEPRWVLPSPSPRWRSQCFVQLQGPISL